LSAADWAARRADAFAEAADAFATNPNGYGGGGSSGSGSSDDGAWVEVCSGQVFRPSAADVGRRVRLECRCVSRDGTLLLTRRRRARRAAPSAAGTGSAW
jgi:hypothetical protein